MISPPSRAQSRAISFPGWWLAGIVAAAAAARAWLHFRTPLAPGINGAYYFVQARAVLEHGLPGVPDLPLTFWLHAALAWLVEHLGGLARDPAVVLAVKSADSLLPALAAVPIAWLGWRWQRTAARPSFIAALAPAALVVLGAQALGMTGEFQKNSLALVWLATLAPAAHVFLTRPAFRTALAPLGLLALLGLTHVGVLGASLVFSALLAVGAIVSAEPGRRRKILALTLGGAVIVAVAATIIYKVYDPSRVVRLIKAFREPSTFLDNPGQGNFPGARGGLPPLPLPLGGGPPGGAGLMRWAQGLVFLAVAGTGLGLAWGRRKSLPPADRTVLVAAAVTAAALGGPFYDMDKSHRLMLIAAVPAAMTLSFVLAAMTNDTARRIVGSLVIVGTLASAALFLPHGGQPTISEAARDELRALAQATAPADRSLIVARHGLEWWAAWILHTHIAQFQAVKDSDWTKFDHVFYLTEKKRQTPPGGPGGRPPRGPGRPADARDAAMGPPNGPPPGGPPGGFPGGGPDWLAAKIPGNVTTVHDGSELKLVLAPTPPRH